MNAMRNLLVAVLLSFAWSGAQVSGALVWEKRICEASPTVAQDVAQVCFPFRNVGDKTITIASIEASCDCTSVELRKNTYEPNESGVITARIARGDKQGDFVKTLLVTTDDERSSQTTLTIKLHLPTLISIQPRYLFFESGQKSPQQISITATGAAPVKLLSATSTRPEIGAKLETIDEKGQYIVTVTPTTAPATENIRATIELRADVGAKKPRLFRANVVLKAGKASTSGERAPVTEAALPAK